MYLGDSGMNGDAMSTKQAKSNWKPIDILQPKSIPFTAKLMKAPF